jgi:hypothetical protein
VNQRYRFPVQGFVVLLLLVAFAMPAMLHAQDVQYSISNEFRYGKGLSFENDNTGSKEYLEDLFNTRFYVGDFTLGFRVQVDKPREYGRDTLGLTQYYAEFNRDGLRARGGTFYNLVGRGMVMNTFESRPLGFNTQSEGIKLNYEMPELSVGGWGGVLNYADILSSTRVEEYLLRGANATIRPIPEVNIGGSYMAATGRRNIRNGFPFEFDAYLREVFVEGNYEAFRAYVNYADKRTPLDSARRELTDSPEFGNGWYGLLGYTSELFGITAEYKDYRFDVVKPNEQQSSSRPTRALPFQNPVTLIPEHDKTLLARNTHAIDVSDELGFQVESLIYPVEDMTITLLAAAASRHNAWTPSQITDTNDVTSTVYSRINENAPIFPNLSEAEFSPYWEVYAQGEYQVDEDLSVIVGLQRRDNTIYHDGDGVISPSLEIVKASTLLLESQIGLDERDNLHAILETQRVYESKKTTPGNDSLGIDPFDGKYMNLLLTLEYSRSPRWSVNTRVEWSSAKNERGGEAFGLGTDVAIWPVIGATYRIGNAHTFGMQYGAERGGMVCTGGVCRLINPFTGFRLSLTSKL